MSSPAAIQPATGAPGPEERARARFRLFAGICAFLLAVLLIEHAGRMARVGFTTHDDLTIELGAREAQAGGFRAAWKEAGAVARGQGRVGYYVSYFLAIAPYMVEGGAARGALVAGVHFLSMAALCIFMGLYLGPAVALLCLTLVYALLPHWWRYFPIGGYPVLFHIPVLWFFTAAILLVAALRRDLRGRTGWFVRVPALVLLGLSLTVYEATTVWFAAILALALVYEWRAAPPSRRRPVAMMAAWAGGVFLCYAALYVAFRMIHPSSYEGNQFSAATVLNSRAAATAMAAYVLSGLPLAQFYFQSSYIGLFSTDSLAELGLWAFWFRSVTVLGIVKAGLFAVAVVSFLHTGVTDGLRRRAVLVGAAACALALLVPAPLAITSRYQTDAFLKAPHVPGYFAYLCLMAAGACVLAIAANRLPRWGRVAGRAVPAAVAAGGFLCVTATQIANDAIVLSQEFHSRTWVLADLFGRSQRFQELPEGAVIVAPTLWDEIDPAWPHYENYWGRYFTAHTGRGVRVVRRLTEAGEKGPRFYLEVQQARDLGRPVLLFQDLRAEEAAAMSSRTLVLSAHDLKGAALRYLARPQGAALETVPLPPCRYGRGAYITETPSPGLITGTATVESIRLASPGKAEGLRRPRDNPPVADAEQRRGR